MKLNPSKCIFGVSSGKFLDSMVSQRGIEVNPKKNPSNHGDDTSKDDQRSLRPDSTNSHSQPLHL